MRQIKYFRPGPNYTWQIDSHSKPKRFGFSLHEFIDGFSRRLISFKVLSSNKKLEIIDKISLFAVRQLRSISKALKVDDSTEQVIVQPIHILLRDSVKTIILWSRFRCVNLFSIVLSTFNLWIETWDRLGWGKIF